MRDVELHALLTLQHMPNLGDVMIKRMLAHFESAEELLNQKKATLLKIDGVGEVRLREFHDASHKVAAEKELDYRG